MGTLTNTGFPVENAAPVKKVQSRSPHPPKTDKFSKVSQTRGPSANAATTVPGTPRSELLPKDSKASVSAAYDPTTGGVSINVNNLPYPQDGDVLKFARAFATNEDASDISGTTSAETSRFPQQDTSGYKSAEDTSNSE